MRMFLLTLQKISVSVSVIVTEICPGQTNNSKSVFFWPKLPKFLAKLNFDFLLHNFSRYVILGFFAIFCTKGSRRYGSDKESVTDKTDGRTDIHGGKINICLPQEETYNKPRYNANVIFIFFNNCI